MNPALGLWSSQGLQNPRSMGALLPENLWSHRKKLTWGGGNNFGKWLEIGNIEPVT